MKKTFLIFSLVLTALLRSCQPAYAEWLVQIGITNFDLTLATNDFRIYKAQDEPMVDGTYLTLGSPVLARNTNGYAEKRLLAGNYELRIVGYALKKPIYFVVPEGDGTNWVTDASMRISGVNFFKFTPGVQGIVQSGATTNNGVVTLPDAGTPNALTNNQTTAVSLPVSVATPFIKNTNSATWLKNIGTAGTDLLTEIGDGVRNFITVNRNPNWTNWYARDVRTGNIIIEFKDNLAIGNLEGSSTGVVSVASNGAEIARMGNTNQIPAHVGRGNWKNFAKAVANTNTIVVMALGDSVAANGPTGFYDNLFIALTNYYGDCGSQGNGGGAGASRINPQAISPGYETNSAAFYSDTWWMNYWIVPATGAFRLSNGSTTNSVTANVIEFDYLAESGGGTFKIQTNINSGGWADDARYTAVSANNATRIGVPLRFTNSVAAPIMAQAIVTSGTVKFLAGGMYDYTHQGIIYNCFARAGRSLAEFVSTPDAIKGPIMRSWNPKLIPMECFDAGAADLNNRTNFVAALGTLSTFMSTHLTNSDIVWVSANPLDGVDTNEVFLQNMATRDWVMTNQVSPKAWNAAYLDTTGLFGSLLSAISVGYLQSGNVHPTVIGNDFVAQSFVKFIEVFNGRYYGNWVAQSSQTNPTTLQIPGSVGIGGVLTVTNTIDGFGTVNSKGANAAFNISDQFLGDSAIVRVVLTNGILRFFHVPSNDDFIRIQNNSGDLSVNFFPLYSDLTLGSNNPPRMHAGAIHLRSGGTYKNSLNRGGELRSDGTNIFAVTTDAGGNFQTNYFLLTPAKQDGGSLSNVITTAYWAGGLLNFSCSGTLIYLHPANGQSANNSTANVCGLRLPEAVILTNLSASVTYCTAATTYYYRVYTNGVPLPLTANCVVSSATDTANNSTGASTGGYYVAAGVKITIGLTNALASSQQVWGDVSLGYRKP